MEPKTIWKYRCVQHLFGSCKIKFPARISILHCLDIKRNSPKYSFGRIAYMDKKWD
jgi:hypothetical protein